MINEIFLQFGKLTGGYVSAQVGLLLATASPTDSEVSWWVSTVRELGSFGLIAGFVIAVVMMGRALIPRIIDQLERKDVAFLTSLEKERELREHMMDGFRDMLHAHKKDIGEKIDAVNTSIQMGNRITQNLGEAIKACPLKKPQQ